MLPSPPAPGTVSAAGEPWFAHRAALRVPSRSQTDMRLKHTHTHSTHTHTHTHTHRTSAEDTTYTHTHNTATLLLSGYQDMEGKVKVVCRLPKLTIKCALMRAHTHHRSSCPYSTAQMGALSSRYLVQWPLLVGMLRVLVHHKLQSLRERHTGGGKLVLTLRFQPRQLTRFRWSTTTTTTTTTTTSIATLGHSSPKERRQ